MHTHLTDETVLVFLGTILVAFERIGLAAMIGGIGVWLIVRCM